MPEDVGYGGSYAPKVVGSVTLNECRDLAGPAPAEGKKWVMINLDNGQFKWYQASRRRSYGGGYRRRSSRSRY
jgi:hypothetical protein